MKPKQPPVPEYLPLGALASPKNMPAFSQMLFLSEQSAILAAVILIQKGITPSGILAIRISEQLIIPSKAWGNFLNMTLALEELPIEQNIETRTLSILLKAIVEEVVERVLSTGAVFGKN